jgi:hypothetical protein
MDLFPALNVKMQIKNTKNGPTQPTGDNACGGKDLRYKKG